MVHFRYFQLCVDRIITLSFYYSDSGVLDEMGTHSNVETSPSHVESSPSQVEPL